MKLHIKYVSHKQNKYVILKIKRAKINLRHKLGFQFYSELKRIFWHISINLQNNYLQSKLNQISKEES